MVLSMAFWRIGCAAGVLAFATLASGALQALAPDEFQVSFDTRKPLGMLLDSSLRITGFHKFSGDSKGPAEASNWLKRGDLLVAVNEEDVSGTGLQAVSRKIADADLPKVLRFRAPRGEDRRAEMRRLRDRPGGLQGVQGSVELLLHGVGQGQFRFVQASFGGRTGCWEAPIVWASPADGCSALANAASVADAVVVVVRGTCAFSAKAANAEQVGARGLIVVNPDGPAFVMPADPSFGQGVALPVVSVSGESGERLIQAVRRMATFESEGFGRLTEADLARGKRPPTGGPPAPPRALQSQTTGLGVRLLVDERFCGAPESATREALRQAAEEEAADEAASRAQEAATKEIALSNPAGHFTVILPRGPQGAAAAAADAASAAVAAGAGALSEAVEVAAVDVAAGATVAAAGASAASGGWTPAQDGAGVVDGEYLLGQFAAAAPGARLRLVMADPPSACAAALANAAEARGAAVLVERGLCSFAVKLAAARDAGAALVVAMNTEPGLAAVGSRAAEEAQADGQGPVPPAVTVTRGAGRRIRRVLAEAASPADGAAAAEDDGMLRPPAGAHIQLEGREGLAERWQDLTDMLEHTRWPQNARTRRKLFYRLSKEHHPDKQGGAADRFELLHYAWRRAGHRWQPEGSAFVDDFAG